MDPTGNESIDELLAEWADVLRHRHSLASSNVVEYTITYSASLEDHEAGKSASYGAKGNDASLILDIKRLFVRDVDTRVAELEAALARVGVTVQRPS